MNFSGLSNLVCVLCMFEQISRGAVIAVISIFIGIIIKFYFEGIATIRTGNEI